MRLDIAGRQFIYREEGVRLKAYLCPAGVATIGVGCTYYPDGRKVKLGDVISASDVDVLFIHVVKDFEAAVMSAIKIPINQNQFNALVSFAYNVGVGAFGKSTFVRRINERASEAEIRRQLGLWVNVRGKANKVLQERREREAELYFGS